MAELPHSAGSTRFSNKKFAIMRWTCRRHVDESSDNRSAVLLDHIAHHTRSGVICYVMVRSIVFCTLLACRIALAAPSPIDFDRDIRPIFSEHCYECHGTDKAKAGLRLNDPKIAFSELKSGV